MKLEPIRLRLVPRQPQSEQLGPRDAFWRALRGPAEKDRDIVEAEGKLRRELGPALRQLLVQELAEPLRQIERTLYHGEFRDLEPLFFRHLDGPRSDRNWDPAQALDAFTRFLEQRQQFFRESPALREAQERVAAASSVSFSVRVVGYSSLNLELSVGSIKGVVEAFENDF